MKRLGWLGLVGGGLFIVILLASSFISPLGWDRSIDSYGWGIGHGMMRGLGFPMMGMMGVGMILFWVLIIGGIIWLVQPLVRGLSPSSVPLLGESSFDILKKRYSRGEITKEQFEEMKRDLDL